MKKNTRIIKRTLPDNTVKFVIQQRHFLFRWWWVDAWINNSVEYEDSFDTFEEAEKNICYFDGTKCKETVISYYS